MILTCPECATSYFVDDARISAAGRTVKCSNCGAKWTAMADGQTVPAPAPAPAAPPAPVPRQAPVDEVVVGGPPVSSKAGKAAKPTAQKEALAKVLVWGASAAVIVLLVGGALVFRDQVVRLWPASGAAYQSLGVPVNRVGLVIEAVRAQPTFQGGRPVLDVTGDIRNIRDKAAVAPDLRVSLLDRLGKPVSAKIAKPIDPNVPALAVRHFAIAIVDPPASVHDLEITFDAGGAKAPAPAKAVPRASVAVNAGPPIVDAKPLPPGSPDALPPHD